MTTIVFLSYLFGGGNKTMTMDELQVLEKNLEIWMYHVRSMKVRSKKHFICSKEKHFTKSKLNMLMYCLLYMLDISEKLIGIYMVTTDEYDVTRNSSSER